VKPAFRHSSLTGCKSAIEAAAGIDCPTNTNTCLDPDGGTTCNAHAADAATCTTASPGSNRMDANGATCVFTERDFTVTDCTKETDAPNVAGCDLFSDGGSSYEKCKSCGNQLPLISCPTSTIIDEVCKRKPFGECSLSFGRDNWQTCR
jgi:hypothetical protein